MSREIWANHENGEPTGRYSSKSLAAGRSRWNGSFQLYSDQFITHKTRLNETLISGRGPSTADRHRNLHLVANPIRKHDSVRSGDEPQHPSEIRLLVCGKPSGASPSQSFEPQHAPPSATVDTTAPKNREDISCGDACRQPERPGAYARIISEHALPFHSYCGHVTPLFWVCYSLL